MGPPGPNRRRFADDYPPYSAKFSTRRFLHPGGPAGRQRVEEARKEKEAAERKLDSDSRVMESQWCVLGRARCKLVKLRAWARVL